jgi:hypothetical protein
LYAWRSDESTDIGCGDVLADNVDAALTVADPNRCCCCGTRVGAIGVIDADAASEAAFAAFFALSAARLSFTFRLRPESLYAWRRDESTTAGGGDTVTVAAISRCGGPLCVGAIVLIDTNAARDEDVGADAALDDDVGADAALDDIVGAAAAN